jgi:hypothetical protein
MSDMAQQPPAYEPYEPGPDVDEPPEVSVDGRPVAADTASVLAAADSDLGRPSIIVTVDGKRIDLSGVVASGIAPHLLDLAGIAVRSLPSPSSVDRLEEPPRRVPLGYRLAAMNMGVVEGFVLFMFGVSPLAVWLLVPYSATIALCVFAVAAVAMRVRRYRRFVPVLRRGEVATVEVGEVEATSTSMTTMPLRGARGWDSRIRTYSGPSYRSELRFTVGGREGTHVLKGRPYEGGVVIADPRAPGRALCVSELPFPARPDVDGRWLARLPVGVWIAVLLTWWVTGVLVGAAVWRVLG